MRLTTAPLSAGRDPMDGLSATSYCAGYTDLSAPDMVVTLDASQPLLSLYARADSDLTMAVRAPDGSWSCNDDSFQLNPGIGFNNAQAGITRFSWAATRRANRASTISMPRWASRTGKAPSPLVASARPTG